MIFFFLLFLTCLRNSYSVQVDCIQDIFNFMNIGAINIIGCSDEDVLATTRGIHNNNKVKFSLIGSKRNLSDIFPIFSSQHHQIGVFFDFNCNSSKEIFMEMSNSLLLNMSFVIVISTDNYQRTIEFLGNTTIAFDTIMVLIFKGILFDLHRIDSKWDIVSHEAGNCSNIMPPNFRKRTNLNGTVINSSLVLMDFPFDGSSSSWNKLLDSTYEPEFEILSRLGLSLHLLLEDINNFKIGIKIVNEWGTYNKTQGHWDKGMFRELELNKADIGLSISRLFTRRLDAAFFFPPCLNYRSCFIFKHPLTLAAYTALIKPLTLNSWLTTISCILICGVFLWIIKKFGNPYEPQNDITIAGNILITLGTVCQQGLCMNSYQIPTRILTFFLLFGGLLIFTFYGASVVGFLLSSSPRTINSIDKLLQSPLQKYSEDLLYLKTHFMNPFSENIEKTYQAIKGETPDEDRYIDIISGIEKVQKGGVALYSQDTNLYAVIDKRFKPSEICALAEIEILKLGISTVIRKKSPYKELLYKGMILIRESGLLNREIQKWNTQRPECLSQEEGAAVTLEATVLAHFIYTTGFLLSIIILITEIRLKRTNNIIVANFP